MIPGDGRMTPGMARALRLLHDLEARAGEEDAPEAEIACEGLSCWIGYERTNRAVVNRLLAHLLVGASSEEGSMARLALNGTGRAAHRRPAILAEVSAAMVAGLPFTVVEDRVVTLDPATGRAPPG